MIARAIHSSPSGSARLKRLLLVSTMAFGLSAGIVPASFAQTPAQDAPAATSTVEEAVAKAEAMRPDIESFMLDNGLQAVSYTHLTLPTTPYV